MKKFQESAISLSVILCGIFILASSPASAANVGKSPLRQWLK